MEKSLLIVESPTKVRTLKKYLGPDFEVKASLGHIKDLPTHELGVDVEKGFQPEFRIISGKDKILKELRQAAKKIRRIYLAPDPDREGEAIAWHLAEELADPQKEFHRVLFHELSPKAIREALAHPETLNEQRFQSQLARRILDRLVGYQISPLLWDKVKRGLSAGRVQSVAVRLIVEREREIQKFISKEYWTITALLQADLPPDFEAKLIKIQGKPAKIANEEQARSLTDRLSRESFRVVKTEKKERKRNPLPPFTTSQLQQEAFRKLRFPAKKTMFLAQRLYEGVEVGDEGLVGLITYMRTDSTRVSQEALNAVRSYIQNRFGPEYLPVKPHVYTNKKSAQDAHEAIRPTSMEWTPDSLAKTLDKDLLALYRLIWNRFLASQMKAALFDQTTVDIQAGDFLLRASGSIMKFPGFTSVYEVGKDLSPSDEEEEKRGQLPPLSDKQALTLIQLTPKQHFTQPPPRYTEATLVKDLEEKGIGRPSTYAAIISTIQEKDYVRKEKYFFYPTELGYLVNDLLVNNFPEILDVQFTAMMENNLDLIEEGKQQWTQVLADFYRPFLQTLERARKEMRQVRGKGLKTEVTCPACGKPMVIRLGKNGPFLACSAYPACKETRNFIRDEKGMIQPIAGDTPAAEPSGKSCPRCGQPMVVRSGRFGPFLACSAYPVCKETQPLGGEGKTDRPESSEMKSDQVCPQCGGPMVVKKNRYGGSFLACQRYPHCKGTLPLSTDLPCPAPGCTGMLVSRVARKKGLRFYGCSRYPNCKITIFGMPVRESCPQCGSPILVEKTTKKEGTVLSCPNKECGYKRKSEKEGGDQENPLEQDLEPTAT